MRPRKRERAVTIGEVITALYASVDKPAQLAGLVVEEARQVQLTRDGPVVVVRCLLGRVDGGGVAVEAEAETWPEALRRWRR